MDLKQLNERKVHIDMHAPDAPENTRQIVQTISLPPDLLARIDSYALKLGTELHIEVSQSGVILRLLSLGLEEAERVLEMAQALNNAACGKTECGVAEPGSALGR